VLHLVKSLHDQVSLQFLEEIGLKGMEKWVKCFQKCFPIEEDFREAVRKSPLCGIAITCELHPIIISNALSLDLFVLSTHSFNLGG
jgi:hypothetical protein